MTKDPGSLPVQVLYICLFSVTRDFQHIHPKRGMFSALPNCAVPGEVWLRLVERLMVTKPRLNHSIYGFFSTALAVVLLPAGKAGARRGIPEGLVHWLEQAMGGKQIFLDKSLDNIVVLISDLAFTVYFFFCPLAFSRLGCYVRSAPNTAGTSFLLKHPGKQHCLILAGSPLGFPQFFAISASLSTRG